MAFSWVKPIKIKLVLNLAQNDGSALILSQLTPPNPPHIFPLGGDQASIQIYVYWGHVFSKTVVLLNLGMSYIMIWILICDLVN